eukprot:g62502.t1
MIYPLFLLSLLLVVEFSTGFGAPVVLFDGEEILTTFSADPDENSLRFSPTWFDVMEGALDWALNQGYQSFTFKHQNLTKAEEGFNLSLANHNLQHARWNATQQRWQHTNTLQLIAGDASFVSAALSAAYSDQLLLHLGPDSGSELDCPLSSTWLSQPPVPTSYTQQHGVSRFCSSPLPFAVDSDSGDTLLQATERVARLFFSQVNNSQDTGTWRGDELWLELTGRQGSEADASYRLSLGPLRHHKQDWPNEWCLQGSRTTFAFPLFGDGADLSGTARVGQGVSSRGSCGAPNALLPLAARSIVVGQSAALTGPTQDLGQGMRAGMLQGLKEAWTARSWRKPRIILLSLDDGYEPARTVQNTLQLVEQDAVQLLAGFVGTPTSKAVFDYVNHTGIPFVCPFTGARFLRSPYVPNIINIRSSYDEEAEGMVEYLMRNMLLRVSLFYQNDAFGQAGQAALELALAKRGLTIYSSGTYERNTQDVEQALADLQATELLPDAVVMVGAAKPTAKFVHLASKEDSRWHAKVQAGFMSFLAISFTGTVEYKAELQALGVAPVATDGEGATSIMLQEVLVPDAGAGKEWDPVFTEGYICGQFLGAAIKRVGESFPVTSQNLLGAVAETGLFKVRYANTILTVGPFEGQCSQGLRNTYLTAFSPSFESKLILKLDLPGCSVTLDDAVQKFPIVFGQSAAFSGASHELGVDMRAGIMAAFEAVNRRGGIQGRLLQLRSYDDGYEPALAINNTQRLLEQNQVFALLGYVGTPTTYAVLDYATVARDVPLVAPLTGARPLRYPFQANVINLRASYDDEVHSFVQYCFAKGKELISIFYQDDGYGQAGLLALDTQLLNRGTQILSKGTYRRNTENVEEGLAKMQDASLPQPQAVVLIGTARALAKFIVLARPKWPQVLFHTVSFVGAEVFATELLAAGPTALGNVYVTQVVPSPFESSPLVLDFLQALQESCPSCRPSYAAMEGYMAGLLTEAILLRMELDATKDRFEPASFPVLRQRFRDALFHNSRFLLGKNIFLGPFADTCEQGQENCLEACNQGMRSVELTQIVALPANASELGHVRAAFPAFSYLSLPEWTHVNRHCNENIAVLSAEKRPFLVVQSAALSGDSAALGREVNRGLRAAMAEHNEKQQIARNITLICYDDGYDPARTVINYAHALTLQPMALTGLVGTPTIMAIMEQVRGSNIPLVGPFSGASDMRYPFHIQPEVLHVRSGYNEEVAVHVRDAVHVKRVKRVSLFAQNDAFGEAGRSALSLALRFWKLKTYSEGTFERNTREVGAGLCQLLLQPANCELRQVTLGKDQWPEAVVMMGTKFALADMLELAANELPDWQPSFYTVSFVGPEQFVGELRRRSYQGLDRLYISAVVPPTREKMPTLWKNFEKSVKLLDSEFQQPCSLAALEGYITGRLLARLLDMTIDDTTPFNLLKSAYAVQKLEVDGVVLGPYVNDTEQGCNQGSGSTYLTQAGLTAADGWEVVNELHLAPKECGVLVAYSDGECAKGYEKIYLAPELNLAYECRIPPPREIVDVSTSPQIKVAIWVVGILLLLTSALVLAVLYLFRNHPILKISSVVFRILIMLGILLIQCSLFVIAEPPSDLTCAAFVWMLQLGFSITMGNMALIVYRIYQIMHFANRKRFRRVHLPNSYLAVASMAIVAVNAVLLGMWQMQDPPSVKYEVYNFQRSAACSFSSGASWISITIFMDVAVLLWSVVLALRLQKILMNKYREASDLREVTMASYNVTFLCIIFIPMLVLLEGNPNLHLILLASFSALLSLTLLSSIYGRRFVILARFPNPDDYVANKPDSVGSSSRSFDNSMQRYVDMPDHVLLELIGKSTPEELMARLRGGHTKHSKLSNVKSKVNSSQQGPRSFANGPSSHVGTGRSSGRSPNRPNEHWNMADLSNLTHSVIEEANDRANESRAVNESMATPETSHCENKEADWKDVEIHFVVEENSDDETLAQLPAGRKSEAAKAIYPQNYSPVKASRSASVTNSNNMDSRSSGPRTSASVTNVNMESRPSGPRTSATASAQSTLSDTRTSAHRRVPSADVAHAQAVRRGIASSPSAKVRKTLRTRSQTSTPVKVMERFPEHQELPTSSVSVVRLPLNVLVTPSSKLRKLASAGSPVVVDGAWETQEEVRSSPSKLVSKKRQATRSISSPSYVGRNFQQQHAQSAKENVLEEMEHLISSPSYVGRNLQQQHAQSASKSFKISGKNVLEEMEDLNISGVHTQFLRRIFSRVYASKNYTRAVDIQNNSTDLEQQSTQVLPYAKFGVLFGKSNRIVTGDRGNEKKKAFLVDVCYRTITLNPFQNFAVKKKLSSALVKYSSDDKLQNRCVPLPSVVIMQPDAAVTVSR